MWERQATPRGGGARAAERPGGLVERTTKVTNTATSTLVRAYAKRNCRKVASEPLLEGWDIEVVVYGHCRAAADQ